AWIARLTSPLFAVFGQEISGRDLILIGGGLFLIAKSTFEVHGALEGVDHGHAAGKAAAFGAVIVQILLLDIVFSLDSVITAVGMTDKIGVMIAAVVGAVGVMMAFAGPIGDFVRQHPTVKMLALSFLILIGVSLLGEGLDFHIPKGYVYFAMAFSVGVEMINLRLRAREAEPVHLREKIATEE
ncbi:MAG: TerC family protein, partial [Bauldia sp.]